MEDLPQSLSLIDNSSSQHELNHLSKLVYIFDPSYKVYIPWDEEPQSLFWFIIKALQSQFLCLIRTHHMGYLSKSLAQKNIKTDENVDNINCYYIFLILCRCRIAHQKKRNTQIYTHDIPKILTISAVVSGNFQKNTYSLRLNESNGGKI